MSNNNLDWNDDFEDDFLEDDFDEQPAPRRSTGDDVVKKLRRSDRAKEKRIKELEAELGSLRKTQRDYTVKSTLEGKGINPKIAAFIPQDLDVNSPDFENWLNEYGDVFGVTNPVEDSQQEISQQDLATLRQMDIVTAGASSPDRDEDIMLRLNQAESADDIINMIYGS
jgi:hypothetical protein